MKKIIGIGVISLLLAGNVSAEPLTELEAAKVAGYYYSDELEMVFMPNGKAYNVTDPSGSQELEFSVSGGLDDFIIEINEKAAYFHRQREKEGSFYAAYLDCIGASKDTECIEGKQIEYGDYVFDNDYTVFEKDSIANFFGVEYAEDITDFGSIEGSGSASPYDVAAAFIEGLKNHDLHQMEAAFAVETFADNVDIAAMIERTLAYTPQLGWVPNDSDFAAEMNLSKRQETILGQIRNLYLAIINCKVTVGEANGAPVMYKADEMDMTEFLTDIFPGNKDEMDVKFERQYIDPSCLNDKYLSDFNQKNIIKAAKYYHPDDVQNVVAFLSIDEKNYLLCMETCRYGDRWYIANLMGNIGTLLGLSTNSSGLMEIPADELDIVLSYVKEQ